MKKVCPTGFDSINGKCQKTLYHITDDNKVKNIMKRGLIPHHDIHMELSGLEPKVINLTTEEEIGYWTSLLLESNIINKPAILKVTVDHAIVEKLSEGWYISKTKIPPKNIRITNNKNYFPKSWE